MGRFVWESKHRPLFLYIGDTKDLRVSGLHGRAGQLNRPSPSSMGPPRPAMTRPATLSGPGRPLAARRRRPRSPLTTASRKFLPHQTKICPTREISSGPLASVTTGNRQVACLQVDGYLNKELLYRYRRYRLHTNGAGIDRPDCNRPAELDPQQSRQPEDFVDDCLLASCK